MLLEIVSITINDDRITSWDKLKKFENLSTFFMPWGTVFLTMNNDCTWMNLVVPSTKFALNYRTFICIQSQPATLANHPSISFKEDQPSCEFHMKNCCLCATFLLAIIRFADATMHKWMRHLHVSDRPWIEWAPLLILLILHLIFSLSSSLNLL